MITLELNFKNAISGKSKRLSIPEPVDNIDELTEALDTHMVTYVQPVLSGSLEFASARLVNREITELIEK